MPVDVKRYNAVAVILHWVMALAFFGMLASGFTMVGSLSWLVGELDNSFKFQLYQWHKSLGVLLLLAFGLRLAWRLVTRAPSLPAGMKKIEKIAAKLGHFGLYFLMFALPMTGWLMVSSSPYGLPTIVFDLFEWPHLIWMIGNDAVNVLSKQAHAFLAIVFALMIALHVVAVVKHYVFDGENLLVRMSIRIRNKR